jgi:hypothetical protein
VKFQKLTGVSLEDYQNLGKAKEQKLYTDTLLEGLDQIDEFLKDPSKGGLTALPIPTQLLRPVVKAIKLAVKAGRPIEQALREGRKILDELLADKDENIQAATNKAFDALSEDLRSVRGKIEKAKEKGTEQGYKFGVAEGKLAGEIRGMARGRKEGVQEGREIEREKQKEGLPLKQANKARKQIGKKIRAKQKKALSVFANDRNTLKEFVKINPAEVSDIEVYNEVADRIKESLANPLIRPDGTIISVR